MFGSTAMKRHWPALLLVVVVVVMFWIAWAAKPNSRLERAAGLVAVVVPSLIAVHQYLYQRADRWRLIVNRVRLTALNPETAWSVSGEYAVQDPDQSLEAVVKLLSEAPPHLKAEASMLADTLDAKVWVWRGVTIRVRRGVRSDPLDGDTPVLIAELPEIRRSYRGIILAGLNRRSSTRARS
jgi:hypothetical protein